MKLRSLLATGAVALVFGVNAFAETNLSIRVVMNATDEFKLTDNEKAQTTGVYEFDETVSNGTLQLVVKGAVNGLQLNLDETQPISTVEGSKLLVVPERAGKYENDKVVFVGVLNGEKQILEADATLEPDQIIVSSKEMERIMSQVMQAQAKGMLSSLPLDTENASLNYELKLSDYVCSVGAHKMTLSCTMTADVVLNVTDRAN